MHRKHFLFILGVCLTLVTVGLFIGPWATYFTDKYLLDSGSIDATLFHTRMINLEKVFMITRIILIIELPLNVGCWFAYVKLEE